MTTRLLSIAFFLFAGLTPLVAQTGSEWQERWQSVSNKAWLSTDTLANRAEAEVFVATTQGGLANYFDSNHLLAYGAHATATERLSAKTIVSGGIAYESRSGEKQTGSAFLHPERRPFDIVEEHDLNSGDKHSDSYLLWGGLSTTVSRRTALGLGAFYNAANYAKYKDLRHKNRYLLMNISGGLTLRLTNKLTAGAHASYTREAESVTFGLYGKEEKVYKSLIDYGAFMGRLEQFGDRGYTDRSREMPFIDDRYGAGLELSYAISPALTLFQQAQLTTNSGYYGRKSPYTIVYTDHSGSALVYSAKLSMKRGGDCFDLSLSAATQQLHNNKHNFVERTNDAGAYYYDYMDPEQVGNKRWTDLSLTLSANLGGADSLRRWVVAGGYAHNYRGLTTTIYPFFRKQLLHRNTISLSVTRQQPLFRGMLKATATGSFSNGSGDPFIDGTYVTPSSKQLPPPTADVFLYREYEYLCAPQYGVQLSSRYSVPMSKTDLNTVFVEATFSHRQALRSYPLCNGTRREELSLSIGCEF